ncbi:ribosome maturation factor RimM [Ligilactobacillus ruminis]|uniref:ribosome maturation factor RimM n=1 Tax=Ligilactobacillus ruminis TaxID=1623 RepID=UPI0009BAA1A3|nr:ribosome maturation factor RimM [Ligilactobacillus ruminis]WDC80807.1 ribosome maturation factor RimM [Ligilactobacillus ruminis]
MNYYQVGKIINTHGIRGEVRVLSTSDFTDERFMPGNALYLFDKGELVKEVIVKTHRKHKQFDLLSFEKLEDINLIEGFKGFDIKISEDQQQDLEDGSYYYHQIIGLDAVTLDGEKIGKISEILAPGANDVWVVKRKGKKELLLPVIDDVIKKVDLEQGLVVVDLLEGLDD